MSSPYIKYGFLTVVLCTALWYSVAAGWKYYNYSRLDARTPAAAIAWRIDERGAEAFTLTGEYTFRASNQMFKGSDEINYDVYRNQWAAEQAVKEYNKQQWIVWYDHQNPRHSSLQKHLPYKEFLYAAVLWGLFLYFAGLFTYATKINR